MSEVGRYEGGVYSFGVGQRPDDAAETRFVQGTARLSGRQLDTQPKELRRALGFAQEILRSRRFTLAEKQLLMEEAVWSTRDQRGIHVNAIGLNAHKANGGSHTDMVSRRVFSHIRELSTGKSAVNSTKRAAKINQLCTKIFDFANGSPARTGRGKKQNIQIDRVSAQLLIASMGRRGFDPTKVVEGHARTERAKHRNDLWFQQHYQVRPGDLLFSRYQAKLNSYSPSTPAPISAPFPLHPVAPVSVSQVAQAQIPTTVPTPPNPSPAPLPPSPVLEESQQQKGLPKAARLGLGALVVGGLLAVAGGLFPQVSQRLGHLFGRVREAFAGD